MSNISNNDQESEGEHTMEPVEVVVKAGQHSRHACPVWVQLPRQDSVPAIRLTDESGAEVVSQLEPSGTGSEDRLWLTWIVRDLAAGQSRRYRIEEIAGPATPDAGLTDDERAALGLANADASQAEGDPSLHRADPASTGVALAELPDGQLSVHIGGDLFTTYYFGSDVARPYFFPMIGPTGKSVTRRLPDGAGARRCLQGSPV